MPARRIQRSRSWWWRLVPAFWGAVLFVSCGDVAWAQAGRPLVDNTSLKLGISHSDGFVRVVRNSDQSEANLVSDSEVSPYIALSTPPLFLFDSSVAVGVSATYAEFTSSQQDFPGQGRASVGSRMEVQMLTITPELSLYIGKNSDFQFFRISVGQGWGFASLKGQVQFGTTPGAEPPENVQSPSGATPAVSFSVEYRIGPVSLAYFGGGPKIETKPHTYTLGEDTLVLAFVINL